jgi:hypothetical protein
LCYNLESFCQGGAWFRPNVPQESEQLVCIVLTCWGKESLTKTAVVVES